MSIQTLSPNFMTANMGGLQQLQGGGLPQALPFANILQSAGQLLSTLTPLLLQASQSSPMAPNSLASSLGPLLQGATSMLGSINQLLASTLQQAAPMQMPMPMNGNTALNQLGRSFDALKGADGMVGRQELTNALSSPFASQDLKSTASFLLNNPGLLSKLDRADASILNPGEMADGRISRGDVMRALNSMQAPNQMLPTGMQQPVPMNGYGALNQLLPTTMQQPVPMNGYSALNQLGRSFDALKGADGNFGRQELTNALSSPFASQDLKSAASFLLNNPGLLSKLDRADASILNPGEMADGRISRGDIQRALNSMQAPMQFRI